MRGREIIRCESSYNFAVEIKVHTTRPAGVVSREHSGRRDKQYALILKVREIFSYDLQKKSAALLPGFFSLNPRQIYDRRQCFSFSSPRVSNKAC